MCCAPSLHNQLADAVVADESLFVSAGALSSTDHASAADPHPTYLTQAEVDALYMSQANTYITQADADARYFLPATLWCGPGVPAAGIASDRSFYFRTDTPNVAMQRMYVKAAGVWSTIL